MALSGQYVTSDNAVQDLNDGLNMIKYLIILICFLFEYYALQT